MIKKLTRHGNSVALVIEKGILDLLNIRENTPLHITTDGNLLIVAPVRDPKRLKSFEAALTEGNARYAQALKNLAG